MVMPWKFVMQFFPWTSSQINLNLRKATSSWLRSACAISNTRPFNPSLAILVPMVLVTTVLPMFRTLKLEGALTSYQSLRLKGSTTTTTAKTTTTTNTTTTATTTAITT